MTNEDYDKVLLMILSFIHKTNPDNTHMRANISFVFEANEKKIIEIK